MYCVCVCVCVCMYTHRHTHTQTHTHTRTHTHTHTHTYAHTNAHSPMQAKEWRQRSAQRDKESAWLRENLRKMASSSADADATGAAFNLSAVDFSLQSSQVHYQEKRKIDQHPSLHACRVEGPSRSSCVCACVCAQHENAANSFTHAHTHKHTHTHTHTRTRPCPGDRHVLSPPEV